MERSQLIYVVTVAECGSVTRAAEKLHLSQPSLSNQIIHLEQELGIALFARVRKRVHLTEAGEVFVRHAQRILNDMQALAERMGGLRSQPERACAHWGAANYVRAPYPGADRRLSQ